MLSLESQIKFDQIDPRTEIGSDVILIYISSKYIKSENLQCLFAKGF